MTNVVRPPTDCGDGSYDLAGASGKARVYYRTTIRRLHNVDVDETANDVNSVDDMLRCAHPITFAPCASHDPTFTSRETNVGMIALKRDRRLTRFRSPYSHGV